MATILENVQGVKARIARAARAAGRDPESVTLLAVSKTHPATRVAEAQAAGLRAFGENYVQEGLQKMRLVSGAEWHLIGALQSNKSRLAAERFDWVQTVDRVRIANRLSEQRPADLPPLNVLIEVNISGEASKSGVAVKEVTELARAIARLPRLRLRGLMCLPPAETEFERQRVHFRRLRECQEAMTDAGFALDVLSAGMSADLEAAVAEGATHLRIGTAIFGPRA